MRSSREVYDRLYEIAADQNGYFTTKQAISAGYADNTHSFHLKAGNWLREHRGIYRLAKYPTGDHPDMVLWHLWSRGRDEKPEGVYSHQTALSLYELSDINPSKLHMTVPPSFRRSSPTPGILVLHRGIIRREDIEERQGFRVTRPLKTISDLLIARSVQMDHMKQAVRQAYQRGIITKDALERSKIPEPIKREIEHLGGRR